MNELDSQVNDPQNKAYLSIDFEDFSHDIKREFQLEDSPKMRVDALDRVLKIMQSFFENNLECPQITFFCTGILAKKYPQIIEQIASYGHEVGCHYHYHDSVRNDDAALVDQRFGQAKSYLEKASGQEILGFRAPRFSIDAKDRERYAIVQKHFRYDSSLAVDHASEISEIHSRLGLDTLRLFPVGRHQSMRLPVKMRTGGSFFKLLPSAQAVNLIEHSTKNGLITMVYLHPYEFTADGDFRLSWQELAKLPLKKRVVFFLKQNQWHLIGNKGVTEKLDKVFSRIPDGGKMCELLNIPDYGGSSTDKKLGKLA